VGILLNTDGVSAFKLGGAEKHVGYSSGRVMAVRLIFRDQRQDDLAVHFVAAHAPTSGAEQASWDPFFSDLTECSRKRRAQDLLVVAIDGNASIGTESSGCSWGESTPCVGKYTAYHMSTTVASVCAATCWSRSLL
jgi:hypothetical protein